MKVLNKEMLYIDRKLEFYIGYSADEECWLLVSIPAMARLVIDRDAISSDDPITVSEIEAMLAKGIVAEHSSKMGDGTWVKILEAVDLEIAKIREA